MIARLTGLLATAALLAACSSSMQSRAVLPSANSFAAIRGQRSDSAVLFLRISLPNERARRLHPAYVSVATKGMTVKIAGPTKVDKTVGLTLSSAGCKSSLTSTQCTLTVALKACPSKKNCYTATVATYDAFQKGKIPKGAHRLSADQHFSFTIGRGNTLIPLTLYGIPASVAFLPDANSSLVGSQKAGFIEPKCNASPQTVSVVGVDADGSYIVGAGAPSTSLKSDDAAQLAVSKSPLANAFKLVPPKAPGYPFGNTAIRFTATATPKAKAGGTTKSAKVSVAYSGDICGIITEFPLPTTGAEPFGIAAGPDAAVWFAEAAGDKIGRVTTAGKVKEYPLPANTGPGVIVTGPDGKLWFTGFTNDKIGRMNPSGTVKFFSIPTANSAPTNIAVGPDRHLWFTEQDGNNVAKITTTGTITEYPVPTANADVYDVSPGPDGNMWFTETAANNIGAMTTNGIASEFPIPTASSAPQGIVAGPDGALWFSECKGNKVGRIAPATLLDSATITSQYPLLEPSAEPFLMTAGPDGALWFTEKTGNRIGRIATDGQFTEFAVPTGGAEPAGIALGPDGALWFTEAVGNKVARLR